MTIFAPGTRVHVVGVGGAGMSGLARLLVGAGAVVSGSDLTDAGVLEELRALGVTVEIGHAASNVSHADVVLWSPAVAHDNVELVAARGAGATLVSRAEVLAELARVRRVIGLTGTHGKTTATSMMVHVMAAAGGDAGRLLGADVLGVGANGHWGSGDVLVEVDESYGSFALVAPQRPRALERRGRPPRPLRHVGGPRGCPSLSSSSARVVRSCSGRTTRGVGGVARVAARDVVRVGTGDGAWRVSDVEVTRAHSRFTLLGPGVEWPLLVHVPGVHNVADAAVVAVLAAHLGVSSAAIGAGLGELRRRPSSFRAAWVVARRRRLRELRAPPG